MVAAKANRCWLLATAFLFHRLAAQGSQFDAPIYRALSGHARQDEPSCFIVRLHDNATDGEEHRIFNQTIGQGPGHVWNVGFRGFVRCHMDDDDLSNLATHPDVAFISEDRVHKVLSTTEVTNTPSWDLWNLDRIDQHNLPLSGTYTYGNTGDGVNVFVVDSGVDASNPELGGRVLQGADFVRDGKGTDDCLGHGTHVSGIVMSTTYGVAKKASIVPVRVMDCSGEGSTSVIIQGLVWAMAQYKAQGRPSVINLSIGGSYDPALNNAVRLAVSAGIPAVVAAGNDGANAADTSPASEPSAITVGASTSSDTMASFSNYGPSLDLFAPGLQIKSTFLAPANVTVMSGTSMAAPHVTGAIARYLEANPHATAAAVAAWVTSAATAGVLSGVNGSPNRLLYVAPELATDPGSSGQPSPVNSPQSVSPRPMHSPSPSTSPTSTDSSCITLASSASYRSAVGWRITEWDGGRLVAAAPAQGGDQSQTVCLASGAYILTVLAQGFGGGVLQLYFEGDLKYTIPCMFSRSSYQLIVGGAEVESVGATPSLLQLKDNHDGDQDLPAEGGSDASLYGLLALVALPLALGAGCWLSRRRAAGLADAPADPIMQGRNAEKGRGASGASADASVDLEAQHSHKGGAGSVNHQPRPQEYTE